jgi:hypothetical protein
MAQKTKRHESPSRIKYEKNHPTISARLSKDKHDKLLVLLRSLGVTLPQLLLHFIDEYEIKIMPIEEARQKGYQEAKKTYIVTYLCGKCGKPIAITSEQAKAATARYMTEHGWRHPECYKQVKKS